ncbi:hypothetical protein HN51_047144 [Arachis hypogaea]
MGINGGSILLLCKSCSSDSNKKYELHFAILMAGSIIFTLNSRLNASMVSVPLEHSQAKILFVDYQLLEVAHSALDLLCKRTSSKLPILVLIADSDSDSTIDTSSISYEYKMLLANGDKGFEIVRSKSEMDPISVLCFIAMDGAFLGAWQCNSKPIFVLGRIMDTSRSETDYFGVSNAFGRSIYSQRGCTII